MVMVEGAKDVVGVVTVVVVASIINVVTVEWVVSDGSFLLSVVMIVIRGPVEGGEITENVVDVFPILVVVVLGVVVFTVEDDASVMVTVVDGASDVVGMLLVVVVSH